MIRSSGLRSDWLICTPGQLTCEWVAGRRARYLAPFQLYFWLSAICILDFQLTFTEGAKRSADANSKAFLCMAAITTLLLCAVYVRQRRMFIEHLVFSLHLHAIMWLFLFVSLTLAYASVRIWKIDPDPLISIGLAVVTPAYFALAARRSYGQSTNATLAKTLLVMSAYFVLLPVIRGHFRQPYVNGQTGNAGTSAAQPAPNASAKPPATAQARPAG